MPDQTIECPYCHKNIPLTEAMSGPIRAQLRKELETEVKQKELQLNAKEKEINASKKQLEQAKESLEDEVNKKVAQEKQKLTVELKGKLEQEVSLELKDLQAQIAEKNQKLQEAQTAELELRKQRRELEERQKNLELELTKKLDAERVKIKDEAIKKAVEEHHLKDMEKDKQMSDMRKQIEDLKRKADQGSQQTQGEVFELELEEMLKANFPFDVIEPVPKGIRGADILQRVHNKLGQPCGTIILEVKQAKSWSDPWISKLKEDQREVNAELALIMSSVLPKDVKNFANVNGVWVSDSSCVISLISVLRLNLIQVASVKQASVGKNEKMELMYNYLSGPEFRHKVEAIVEGFVAMKAELDQEKRAMTKIWSKREKQIEKVIGNTAKMYGDMQGIIGASLPQIKSLELKSLTDGSEEEVEETTDDPDMPF